jgi:hypothetical protein
MSSHTGDGLPAPDEREESWVPGREDREENELLEPDVIDEEEACPIRGYPYPCHCGDEA